MPRSTAILHPALSRLAPQLRERGVAVLDDPTCDTDVPIVITSDDAFLGEGAIGLADRDQFRPDAADSLARAVHVFPGREVRVVLYTHRQDRLMEFSWLRQLVTSRMATFSDTFPQRFEPVLDYRDLVRRLVEVPGVREVIVRPVEIADAGTHAFVDDFLGLVALQGMLDLDPIRADITPHPMTLTGRGAALAADLHPHLADEPGELALLHDLGGAFAGMDVPGEVLNDTDRRRIIETYRESNTALFAEYAPGIPANCYDDDIATFELGNLLPQPSLGSLRGQPPARLPAARMVVRALQRRVTQLRRAAVRG